VLLDLRLPKLSGLEVLKAIRTSRELHTVPVVVLTTSTADRDVGCAYGDHVNSYLVKPVAYAQFAQLMHALSFYWLKWNYYPGLSYRAVVSWQKEPGFVPAVAVDGKEGL